MQQDLVNRAATLGDKLLTDFRHALEGCSQVATVRGKGLMLGIELKKDCPDLVAKAAAQGLLINVTAGKVIRLLPPLIMTDDDANTLVNSLSALIRDIA
jgi:acetylornithine aminotransferase